MVDVQPHYFGGLADRVDLVIDHHPEQPGYTAVFKDIRADYGSTSTILTEHLRAVDVNISERTATALLYAIKSDTLDYAGCQHDLLAAIVFCAPQKVDLSVINGKVVVQDGHLTTLDLGPVVERHNKISRGMLERAGVR